MQKFLQISFSLLIPIMLLASPKVNVQKVVPAYKLKDYKIVLDGKLTEPVWQKAPVKDFTQRDPNEGGSPTEETNVWVAYDETNLYVAAHLKDSHSQMIDANLARRDAHIESDWFTFFVDPYNDKRTGYYFAVNAGGTMSDGVLYNDSWDDETWDGIWEAKTSIDETGWFVEMRIPFSQLRFKESNEMTWGVNFSRDIKRNKEYDYFVMVPKKESGFVSRFALLEGLNGIKPKQRFELLPYVVQKANYLVHDQSDPFYKSKQYKTSLGADLKIGLGTNLNIDATINPDFGQVEVDPAVINLSAFESYFQEKRPFFIEGSNVFLFGIGGANNNWGFNFSWPQLFYSRRIGHSPQGTTSSAEYLNTPNETRILGAAKLTGKLDETTSVGAVSAITERTFATLFNNGIQTSEEVEPFTHYGVFRAKRELNGGNQAVGFMFTTVNRSLNNNALESLLAKDAFTFGLDGFSFLDENKEYVVTGAFAGSYTHGSKEYLQLLQEKPYRYFQRPDATYERFDPNRTSLGGWYGRAMLNKQQGSFYINAALGAVSPGFEHNDLGFQFAADRINGHLVLGYRWFEPDGFFRKKQIYLAHARSYNFEGNMLQSFFWSTSTFQFMNYWQFQIIAAYGFEGLNASATRGGPLVINPSGSSFQTDLTTDSREKIIFELTSSYDKDDYGSEIYSIGLNTEWKPNSQLSISAGPQFEQNNDQRQWVGNFEDPTAVNTYGNRYVFAHINQKVLSANIRLNWTFSPTLSLQLFLQPLLAVGDYNGYKEVAKPRSSEINRYGAGGSTINYDSASNVYTVDPDGNGPAKPFEFANPNFNFKSLRGNAVLRWEVSPGTIFYFVWSHDQQNYDDAGSFEFGRDLRNLWKSAGNDVFAVKFSYWLDI